MTKCDANNPGCNAPSAATVGAHRCIGCDKKVHAVFCSTPYDELSDDRLKELFKKKLKSATTTYKDVCKPCIAEAKAKLRSTTSAATAATKKTAATAATKKTASSTATKKSAALMATKKSAQFAQP